jgi:hypothetical protein
LFIVYVAIALFDVPDCEHVADSVTSKDGNVRKFSIAVEGKLSIPLNVAVIVKGEYPVRRGIPLKTAVYDVPILVTVGVIPTGPF